jgi:hypothetical protein
MWLAADAIMLGTCEAIRDGGVIRHAIRMPQTVYWASPQFKDEVNICVDDYSFSIV